MKTVLPVAIKTIPEAEIFLTELHKNNEAFHPEDDALDLVGDKFTKEEGEQLNKLMTDIYALPGNSDPQNMSFDPCGFLLRLDPEYAENEDAEIAEEKQITHVIKYKGFEIHNANPSHCSLVYKDGQLVKCIAGDIAEDGKTNRTEKAKKFIDEHVKKP